MFPNAADHLQAARGLITMYHFQFRAHLNSLEAVRRRQHSSQYLFFASLEQMLLGLFSFQIRWAWLCGWKRILKSVNKETEDFMSLTWRIKSPLQGIGCLMGSLTCYRALYRAVHIWAVCVLAIQISASSATHVRGMGGWPAAVLSPWRE